MKTNPSTDVEDYGSFTFFLFCFLNISISIITFCSFTTVHSMPSMRRRRKENCRLRKRFVPCSKRSGSLDGHGADGAETAIRDADHMGATFYFHWFPSFPSFPSFNHHFHHFHQPSSDLPDLS